MNKILTAAALAAIFTVGAVANADAWTRNGTVTGPYGSSTIQGSGSCAGGTCARQVTRTGPYGYSVNRQGSASCSGGVCTGNRQTTGPRGNTVYRSGTVTR